MCVKGHVFVSGLQSASGFIHLLLSHRKEDKPVSAQNLASIHQTVTKPQDTFFFCVRALSYEGVAHPRVFKQHVTSPIILNVTDETSLLCIN